jgi:hypothetical protein
MKRRETECNNEMENIKRGKEDSTKESYKGPGGRKERRKTTRTK